MRSILRVLVASLLITSAVYAGSNQVEQTLYTAAEGVTDRQFSDESDTPDETGRSVALLSASNLSSAAAAITWVSQSPYTGKVEYGLTPELGSIADEGSLRNVHFVWLTGLPPGQTIYYRVGQSKKVESFQTAEIGAGMPKAVYGVIPPEAVTLQDDVLVKLTLSGPGGSSQSVSVRASTSDIWLLNLGNLKTTSGSVFSYSSDMTATVSIEGIDGTGKPAVLYAYTTDLNDNDLSELPMDASKSGLNIVSPWQSAPKATTTVVERPVAAGPTKERRFLESLLAKGAQARLDNRKGHGEPFMVPGWRGGNTMKSESRPPAPGPAPDRIRLRGEVVLAEITKMRRENPEAARFFPDVARHFGNLPDLVPSDISSVALETGINIFALDVDPYATVTSYSFLTDVTNANEITDWDGTLQQFGASAVKIDDVVSGDNYDLDLGYGYFVTMTDVGSTSIDGDPVTSPVYTPIPVGLEVVSLVGQASAYTSYTIFTDLFDGTEICQFNTDLQSYQCAFIVGSTPMGDEFNLEDGSGYFVRSETAGAFPIDNISPTLAVSAPPDGDTIYTKQPFIDILYGDPLGGVNQSTFICEVNGQDKSSRFSLDEFGATWQMDGADELLEGINTIEAWVSDNYSNQANVLSTFMVVTTPPASDDHFVNGYVFHGDTWEPLEGAAVTINGIDGVVFTDYEGHYLYPTPGAGTYTINIEKENYTYAQRPVEISESMPDVFVDDAFLNPRDPVSTRITADEGGVAINSDASVYTSFPVGAVEEDIDVSAFNLDDPEDLPDSLPGNSIFTYCVKFWPDKVEFLDSVYIDQLNSRDFDAGVAIPLGHYNPDSSKWLDEGWAYVASDNTWFDWNLIHFLSFGDCNVSGRGAYPGTSLNTSNSDCNGGANNGSPSLGMVKSKYGGCLLSYSLPSLTSFGANRALSLTYASHTALPRIVIEAETRGIASDTIGSCAYMSVEVDISGERFECFIYPSLDSTVQRIRYFPTVPDVDSDVLLPTARYECKAMMSNFFYRSLDSTDYFGGYSKGPLGPTTDYLVQFSQTYYADVMVENRSESKIGGGWALNGVQKLFLGPDSGALITTGGGAANFFEKTNNQPVYDILVDGTEQSSSGLTYYRGTEKGGFDAPVEIETDYDVKSISTADFDDDGWEDIAVGCKSTWDEFVSVLLNDGAGNFPSEDQQLISGDPGEIIAPDFNNDDLPDLAFSIWSNRVGTMMNNGDGTFAEPEYAYTGSGSRGIVAEDFNEDTFMDVAVGCQYDDCISILWGDGTGSFSGRTDIPMGSDVTIYNIATGDFNEDGHIDMAVGPYPERCVLVFLNDGSGGFPQSKEIDLDTQIPSHVTTGDFTGDGHLGLAMSSPGISRILVLEGNERGDFGDMESYPTGYMPSVIRSQDFNGDSYSDIAALSVNDTDVVVHTNDGTGYFAATERLKAGLNPSDVQFVNLNGDMFGDYRAQWGDFSTLILDPESDGFIRIYPDSTKVYFDENGFHTSTVDRNGNTTTYGYDIADRLITVTHPGDLTTTIAYGPDSKIETITDPADRVTTFDHDLDGNLISITDPDSKENQYQYYDDHLIKKTIDPKGNETTYEYDDNGYVSKVIGPDLSTNEYLASDAHSTATDAIAEGFGSTTMPASPVLKDDRVDFFVNTFGDTTKTWTNEFGRKIRKLDPLGRQFLLYYDKDGNVTSVVEPNDHFIYFTYNKFSQPLTVADSAIEATVTLAYDSVFHFPYTIEDPEGHITTIERDENGNPIRIINALGDTTLNFFDSNGLLVKTKNPLGDSAVLVYNDTGRLVEVINPLDYSAYCEYDEPGNVTAFVDANSKRTEYEYDNVNRVTLIRDAEVNETSFRYDDNGNLVALGNAIGDTTRFTYDVYNRLTSETDTLGFKDEYFYNSEHLLTAAYNPNGDSVTFVFDKIRRLTHLQLPDDTTEYEYDNVSNLLRIEDSVSMMVFDYDDGGRLNYVETGDQTNPDIIQPYLTIDYTLNKLGNVTQRTDSESWTVTYGYDDLSRLTTITSGASVTTYAYDRAGKPDSTIRSNGAVTKYVFDEASRLTDLTHVLSSDSIGAFHYTLDNVGIRTGLTDLYGDHTFGYDDIYQLTGATHPQVYNPTEIYSYDPLGNRLNSHLSTSYTHDKANRLLEDDDREYSYDDAGRMVWKRVKATEDTTYFEYTVEDELVRVYNDDVEMLFAYDGAGDRIQTTTITNSGADTNIVKFSHDGSDLLYEHDEDDAVVVKYLYGPGIDNILETTDQSGTYYHYGDALGSVTKATDASGTEARSRVYDSFGNIVSTSGSLLGDRVSFTGREYESDLGLYYYRARYYDPNIGRFISRDPIGSPNLYSYTANDPMNGTDPFGLDTKEDLLHAGTGLADILSLGLGPLLRGMEFYGGDPVNYCSGWYEAGNIAGYGAWAAIAIYGLVASGAADYVDNERGGSGEKLGPDADAEGPHSTWETDPKTGKPRKYSSWEPNPDNPSGWDEDKHYDQEGGRHYNKKDKKWVPTPHVHDRHHPGDVREPDDWERPDK